MARRNTKADRILNESAMRLEAARMRVDLAQSQLNTARAVLEAVQVAHEALEKELTPTPRKASTKKATASASAQQDPPADKDAKCGICGNPPDHADHDRTYVRSHDFEAPKPVVRAGRKSRTKPGDTSSAASSEIEKADAGNVALGASAGD
jgi:DNA repair exonuclease SbcCD ATPase subunit